MSWLYQFAEWIFLSSVFSFVLVANPCDKKKCEFLCLLSPSGPVCACPNNYVADNATQTNCVERVGPTQSPICEFADMQPEYKTHFILQLLTV